VIEDIRKPLILFPSANLVERKKKRKFYLNDIVVPDKEKQKNRLVPQFQRLIEAFEKKRMFFQQDVLGIMPEQVLVFETAGSIEGFISAVKKIKGLEWLVEWETEFDPDDDFYKVGKNGEKLDKPVDGRLFLVMSDQQALQQLKSLSDKYFGGHKLPDEFKKWGDLFKHLRTVRYWNVIDRFEGTRFLETLNDWIGMGKSSIRFEVELWYQKNDEKRKAYSNNIRNMIRNSNGKILKECIIPQICYHALLAEAPVEVFKEISEDTNVRLLQAGEVMFFRPVGQATTIPLEGDPVEGEKKIFEKPRNTEPLVAVLDGMPLENHDWLRGRLIVDDPDEFQESYQADERVHGTAMASLILHGELDDNLKPLSRPVYVRPILKPNRDTRDNPPPECIPDDVLPVDLLHRAVRRMFAGSGTSGPVAPTVKVINLSVADAARPFSRIISPWARLLDWLSYEYKVLFIVSAGNYVEDIVFDGIENVLRMPKDRLSEEVLKCICRHAAERRILSPAESINALTVGALHEDSSLFVESGRRMDIMKINPMISPITRIGFGYKRSVKPDVVMKGGRQLYIFNDFMGKGSFAINKSNKAPGQKVAFPGHQGNTSSFAYTRGTSNATALTTRLAHELCEMLYELRETQPHGEQLSDEFIPILVKALIVHGASWRNVYEKIEKILGNEYKRLRERIVPRLFGYGVIDSDRIFYCTEQRATLIGCGKLRKDQAHLYSVPLPPSLSSKKEWRRLTITLAWFSPINSDNLKYRQAALYFEPPVNQFGLKAREEVDANAVRRGTVQHEILEGNQAVPFMNGEAIEIRVNCREDAGGLKGEVPYALVVSFEVKEGVNIQVYEEIQNLIAPRVRIQPS